jgi:hypothetical protein
MKPTVRINNWAVVATASSPYQAPECAVMRLSGNAINHGNFQSGEGITTGRIIDMDLKARRVETVNTVYELEGPPSPEWLNYLKSTNYDLSKLLEWV